MYKQTVKTEYAFVTMKINTNRYPDVVKKLESVPSRNAYLISLVQADIERGGEHDGRKEKD